MKKILLLFLVIGLCASCMHQNKLGEFTEKNGHLKLTTRKFNQDFKFGDCFLYQEGNERYMLIVMGVHQGEFTNFLPVNVPAVDTINEFSVGKFMVNYYSREPSLLDKMLGGEMQYGGFGFSVFQADLPQLTQNLEYLFTMNFSPEKLNEYGSTALATDYPLGYTIRFCLDFESMHHNLSNKPMVAKLSLESLCL